jgi:hypothetical protein
MDQAQFDEIDEEIELMMVCRTRLVAFMNRNEYAADEEINEKSREILADVYDCSIDDLEVVSNWEALVGQARASLKKLSDTELCGGLEDMEELTEKGAVSIFVHIPD